MIFCPIFHSWHDLLRKLNEGSWIDDIYASNSHKIKKIYANVNRECWPFTRPRAWLFLSRPLNFGAACLISCSRRRVNQHILRWLLENVILHHQVKMEVWDGGDSSASMCNTRESAKCNVKCTKQPISACASLIGQIFKNSKIEEEELRLEWIVQIFLVSGHFYSILLYWPKHQTEELQFLTAIDNITSHWAVFCYHTLDSLGHFIA